jgi:hypothetical protein
LEVTRKHVLLLKRKIYPEIAIFCFHSDCFFQVFKIILILRGKNNKKEASICSGISRKVQIFHLVFSENASFPKGELELI